MTDPSQALQQILQPSALKNTLFPATSRYYGIDTATLETAEGKTIMYLTRRFCPQPERFTLLQEHIVAQGDRLDNVTATYLGDPEQFWRICDANVAMLPDDVTGTIGRHLRITLPEGIPGVPSA